MLEAVAPLHSGNRGCVAAGGTVACELVKLVIQAHHVRLAPLCILPSSGAARPALLTLKPLGDQPCAAGSPNQRPLCGASARCLDAAMGTQPVPVAGVRTRLCDITWTTIALAVWQGRCLLRTFKPAAWTCARYVGCSWGSASMALTHGADHRLGTTSPLTAAPVRTAASHPWTSSQLVLSLLFGTCLTSPALLGPNVSPEPSAQQPPPTPWQPGKNS